MKVVRVRLMPFRLPLRRPLLTARGPISQRPGVLVALEGERGARGFGAASPIAGFSRETPERCLRDLEKASRRLVRIPMGDLDALLDEVDRAAPHAPTARGALDAALHDLAARERGVSLAELLAPDFCRVPRERVRVNALLDAGSASAVERAARRAVGEGFRTLKLKVGGGDPAEDDDRVAALFAGAATAPDTRIRLDANGGWKEPEAERALAAWERFRPEFVEQPLPAQQLAGMARLRAGSPIPIAADEAVTSPEAALALIEAGAADLLVLKPSAVGGLRAAARIARLAAEAEVSAVVTSMLDSSIGVAAALHLAAALPPPLPACGLATGLLLADDLTPPLPLERGAIALPSGDGLGLDPEPRALERCADGSEREVAACS